MTRHKKKANISQQVGMGLWQKSLLLIFALAFVGLVLETQLGDTFIFKYGKAYYAAMPWLYGLLLPVFALVYYRYDARHQTEPYAYSWLRWLLLPLIAGLASTLLIYTPFGWAALAARFAGGEPSIREAKVITAEYPRHRIGKCDQKILFEVDAQSVNICVEDKLAGKAPAVGGGAMLKGRESVFGFIIDEVRAK